jgi:hypothetical protein
MDQEIQYQVARSNSKKNTSEQECNNVQWDCNCFAKQVETIQVTGAQVIEQLNHQIRTFEYVMHDEKTGIGVIYDQSQEIISSTTDKFDIFGNRVA